MTQSTQRLLVSVRGPIEAIEAAKGGAHIVDVEYPASALGTPYPLNIDAVRETLKKEGFSSTMVSTNIGEIPSTRASACQAALGVAASGANLIKFGLAEHSLEAAIYIGRNIVRTVRILGAKYSFGHSALFPAVFLDDDMVRYLDPLEAGAELVEKIDADGILLDTYNKLIGKGFLDYWNLKKLQQMREKVHAKGKQLWIAGSVTADELPSLWATGVDVICVRGAACAPGSGHGRFGEVKSSIVEQLVRTIPQGN